MCNNKILHQSKKAFVVYCWKCGHIQIAFGTTGICFTEKQFEEFFQYICDFFPKYQANSTQKTIWIPIINQTISLVLSIEELADLRKILEEAYNSLDVVKLLKEINPN